jgi:oligosaccharide repeat unit polymerase
VEVSTFLLSLWALVLLWGWIRKSSFFSPWALWATGQILTLGIAYLKFNPRMTDFCLATWLVWWGSTLAFMSGCACALLRPTAAVAWKPSLASTDATCRWAWISAGVYIAGTIAGYMVVGGWPIFSRNPGHVRTMFQSFSVSAIFSQETCWLLMAALPLLAGMAKGRRKHLFIGILISALLYGLLTGYRLSLFFGLFAILATRDLFFKRIPVFKLILASTLIVAFVSYLFVPQNGNSRNKTDAIAAIMGHGAYDYVANNYWNLDAAVRRQLGNNPHQTTFGALFFEPPLIMAARLGKVEESLGWGTWKNENSIKTKTLNTISIQWSMIKEMGFCGVGILSFMLGYISTRLYSAIRDRRSEWSMLLYVPVGFSIVLSFFLYVYQTPMFWLIWTGYAGLYILNRGEMMNAGSVALKSSDT